MHIGAILICRTKMAAEEFKSGLNDVALWACIEAAPEAFMPLFCTTRQPLTRLQFKALFEVTYSDDGTNLRAAEDETVYGWECLLLAIESKGSC